MSHITKIEETEETVVSDLTALRRAVERLGGVFKSDQKQYQTWASDNNTNSIGGTPEGFSRDELGQCEHAIGLNNNSKSGPASYEIGVVPSKKYSGSYVLMYDPHGGKLDEKFSSRNNHGRARQDLGKLRQYYNAEAVKRQAEQNGDTVSETVDPQTGEMTLEVDTSVRIGV